MTRPNIEARYGAATAMNDKRSPALSPELSELLRTGPFEAALRAAIRTSRLSLDRIQHHLRARGTPVSITALSYWQSGRRRPERPDSLLAVRQLEQVLGIPQGALFALVGPPRPRGRNSQPTTRRSALTALWTEQENATELLTKIDTSHDHKLMRLSHHDVVHVDKHGEQRRVHTKKVVRAEADGVDRWILMFDGSSDNETPAVIRPLRSCRLGQVLTDHARDLVVAELLFDRTLSRGETLLLEYEVLDPPAGASQPPHSFCRVFRMPIRQYVLEMRFAPENPPYECESYVSESVSDPMQRPTPLSVDEYGHTHVVTLDFNMGVFGARWQPASPRVATSG